MLVEDGVAQDVTHYAQHREIMKGANTFILNQYHLHCRLTDRKRSIQRGRCVNGNFITLTVLYDKIESVGVMN